jgi:hypothetical protein
MSRTIVAIIAFIITYAVVLGILQFIVKVSGAILKLGIGAVIALIAAGIAFAVARGVSSSSNP